MKINRLLAMCLVIALSACSKEKGEEVSALEFDVSTKTQTVKAGEEVKFDISGNAGGISFYSGEIGNDYTYKDNPRVDAVDRIEVSFRTHNQSTNKTTDPIPSVFHGATLKVMLSTDFNGTYNYPNINNANWIDITDRFHMSPMVHWNGLIDEQSGIVDVNDLRVPGEPFYIAFKFESPTGIPSYIRWRMYGLKVESFTASGKSAVLGSTYSTATPTYLTDYQIISRDNPQNSKSYLASSAMLFSPSPSDTSIPQSPTLEEWGIGKAYLAKDIILGTEKSKVAQAFGKPAINEYTHTFAEPGTYKVVFVATKYGSNEIVKEITITVLPVDEIPVPEV